MNNVEVWLWLLLVMLPHNPRTHELLKQYGSVLATARAMRDGQCTMLTPQERKRVQTTHTKDVRAIIDNCTSNGIRIITIDDPDYPERLISIQNPPIVLFIRGDVNALSPAHSLSAVGARQSCDYSLRAAKFICGEAARSGAAIISGLAVGADTAAHRSALDNGGITVGVMAAGLLVNYPAESEQLKLDIIANGGAIISELLPNSQSDRTYFQMRNRIIAGLGMGTLIIEATEKSGTMLTAKHTIQQRKPVFVIPPHDIFSESFSGQAALIRKGAAVISSAEDICRRLGIGFVQKPNSMVITPVIKPEAEHDTAQEKPASKPQPHVVIPSFDLSSFTPEKQLILSALKEKNLTSDELISATGLGHEELCDVLLELELDDVIIRNREGNYSLA